jgi:nucleoside-diphosphate-sugar epimerase
MTDRVAVTGATGFIGWHACAQLRDTGWKVVAIVRPDSQKPLPEGVERVPAVLEAATLKRACAGVSTIVHAAGITSARSAQQYARVNVDGTQAAAEAARALDARLVHISSLTAGGPASADKPRDESHIAQPITAYGFSKLRSEELLTRVHGLRWTTIRPAAVYGPRDRQFLPLFQAAKRGVFLRPANARLFSLTVVHVADVAQAISLTCGNEATEHETLFVGHPTPVSLDGLLETLAVVFGRAYRPVPVPLALVRCAAWLGVGGLSRERWQELTTPGFVCSVQRAEQRLGFRAAVGLTDGLRATADWYSAHRWLS